MEITFWLFITYIAFIFLMFAILALYGLFKGYWWWNIPGILCILTLAFVFDFYAVIFTPIAPGNAKAAEREFIIPRGANLAGIGDILKNQGLIKNTNQFRWIASLLGYEKGLKAGKFKVAQS